MFHRVDEPAPVPHAVGVSFPDREVLIRRQLANGGGRFDMAGRAIVMTDPERDTAVRRYGTDVSDPYDIGYAPGQYDERGADDRQASDKERAKAPAVDRQKVNGEQYREQNKLRLR